MSTRLAVVVFIMSLFGCAGPAPNQKVIEPLQMADEQEKQGQILFAKFCHSCHPDGEAGMYRAAQMSSNTPMCLSNNSSQSIEQVAKGAQGQLWWQFYPRQDLGASQELLERAQGAGYTAMVITVDQQASFYERSQHDRNLGGRAGGGGREVHAR